MKRLIISDIRSYNNKRKSVGHYIAVAQNYIDLYNNYFDVKVAGGPIFKDSFKIKNYVPLPYDFIEGGNWIKNKLKILINCRFLFKSICKEDIVVIQQSGLSTILFGIVLFAKKRSNIYIISYDTDAISSKIKKIIYSFAKKKIKGIICPNERIMHAFDLSGCIVPDYIYTKNIENFVPYNNKKYDIAILGRINADKGVIEAAKYLSNTKYKVLIAGKADENLICDLKNICNSSSNIILNLDFINDEDYNNYIRYSRYCLLNYRGTYNDRSSGVVLDNLFNGTPILGHNCRALTFIEKEKLGYLFDDLKNIDFNLIFTENTYVCYQKNIIVYLKEHKKYKSKVIEFLNQS
ncbi:MAG: glycosyltransferase [Prevotella sp.]|uniref:hypothetical protein n=1 Tax=Prevotella sp. TaxID=59823 RepID=UPI00257966A5|nr:hypothetical protein [Prevotella sp.]MBS5876518.1 glycosyltransferase [Prevotella sp.]